MEHKISIRSVLLILTVILGLVITAISFDSVYAASKLKAPKNFHVYSTTASTIGLDWNSVSGAKSYNVYKYYNGKYRKLITTKKSYYKVKNLYAGTKYYFYVRACKNSKGTSTGLRSTKISRYTKSASAPKNFVISNTTSKSAKLTWDKTDGAKYYRVYMSSGNGYAKVATVYSNYYTKTKLLPNKKYYFYVSAYNGYGSAKRYTITKHIYPSELTLAKESAMLYTGQTLNALSGLSTYPSNSTYKSYTWTSSNPDVAKVSSSGVITAVSKGTATIKVSAANYASDTLTVNVETFVNSIDCLLSETTTTVGLGQTINLSTNVNPSSVSPIIESSNPSVVSVSGDILTANAIGSATITMTANNLKITRTVNVVGGSYPTAISLDKSSLTLNTTQNFTTGSKTYESGKVNASVSAPDGSDSTIVFTSSNPSVATVDSGGNIHAVSQGTSVITAKTVNNLTAKCYITVNLVNEIKSVKATYGKDYQIITLGNSQKLALTVNPSSAPFVLSSVSSSNESVATCDINGNLTPKKAGYTTVSASYKSGQSKVETVEVNVQVLGNGTVSTPYESGTKTLSFGMSVEELRNTFGKETEVLRSSNDYLQYVYANDYNKFMLVGVKQNKVINVYTQALGFNFRDFTYGMTESDLKAKGIPVVYGICQDKGYDGWGRWQHDLYQDFQVEYCMDISGQIGNDGWTGDPIVDPSIKGLYGLFIEPNDYSSVVSSDWHNMSSAVLKEATHDQARALWYIVNSTRVSRHQSSSGCKTVADVHSKDPLPPYKWSKFAYDVASWKSQDMIDHRYFSHTDDFSSNKEQRSGYMTNTYIYHIRHSIWDGSGVSEDNLLYFTIGIRENIAANCYSAWGANCGLYNSGGHRLTITSAYGCCPLEQHMSVGLAVDLNSPLRYYWTQTPIGKCNYGTVEWYEEHYPNESFDFKSAIEAKRAEIRANYPN